ncbi:MAG: hypothetical protein JWN76_3455 [Chitinophagaceae bacterium]|nr:hypothetical protein [Chitinophagaceae bacterium]
MGRIKVKIKENSLFAFMGAVFLRSKKMALVTGSTIHLWKTTRQEFLSNQTWVCHELKHVQQYQQYGMLKFLIIYFIEFLKNGYENNRLEKEARDNERNTGCIELFEFTS